MQITKLTTKRRYLAKQFSQTDSGVISTKGYDSAKHFSVELVDVNSIFELSALLHNLEGSPYSALIRGVPHPDTLLDKDVRRRKYKESENVNEAPFIDEPIPWMLIDIDALALPEGYDYIANPEHVVEYTISQLPSEFHNSHCHWQFSSSAGIKDKGLIKLHLWFWLSLPYESYQLKEWARKLNQAGGITIDPAVYNPVQIHYTAAPIFLEHTQDPLTVRSGLLERNSETVTLNLDIPETVVNNVSVSENDVSDEISTLNQTIKGFEGFLATLGDGVDGHGFYEPLLKATSSIVATKGPGWVAHNQKAIIRDIQERITDADQSNHSIDDMARYHSSEYLSLLLESAIAKGFGSDVTVELPYFNTEPLSLKEGEERLKDAIRRFHGCIVMANRKRKLTPLSPHEQIDFSQRKQNLAIKAAAGLGKTSQIISELISMRVKSHAEIHIEYYVPTHKLGSQVEKDIKEAFAEKAELIESITTKKADINVKVIRGRTNETPEGVPMCQKTKEASILNKLGKSVEFLLCNNGSEQCEFYKDCLYQNQFKQHEHELNELNLPSVTIMAHNHLFHNKRESFSEPEFIVVDESFYQAGIEQITLPLDKVRGVKNRITRVIYDALLDGEPLLKVLRDNAITPYILELEAKNHRPELGVSNISPAMSWSEQQRKLSLTDSGYFKLDQLLLILAEELSVTDRDESYTLSLSNDDVTVKKRIDMAIPEDVPVLFIDADLNRSIANLYRADTEVIEIPVERQATVHQFNHTWGMSSLEDKAKSLFQETKDFIGLVNATGSTLIVTSNQVQRLLTKDSETSDSYCGVPIVHYSNLRGVNDYSGYKNVIVIGREQPSPRSMEALAKGLWWDRNEEIAIVPLEGDSSPYLRNMKRGYRMRNHSPEGAKVQLHPDKRVQDVLELAREAEITQGIDRLRLVRGSKDRQVFILTSIPVDITVDYVWIWERFQEFLTLWAESDGVLPLKAQDLLKILPQLNLGLEGARDLTVRLKKVLPLIGILISEDTLFSSYRTNASKGVPPKVIISSKHKDPKAVLVERLGEVVTSFEILNSEDV